MFQRQGRGKYVRGRVEAPRRSYIKKQKKSRIKVVKKQFEILRKKKQKSFLIVHFFYHRCEKNFLIKKMDREKGKKK